MAASPTSASAPDFTNVRRPNVGGSGAAPPPHPPTASIILSAAPSSVIVSLLVLASPPRGSSALEVGRAQDERGEFRQIGSGASVVRGSARDLGVSELARENRAGVVGGSAVKEALHQAVEDRVGAAAGGAGDEPVQLYPDSRHPVVGQLHG